MNLDRVTCQAEVEDIFEREMPPELARSLVLMIHECYRAGHEHAYSDFLPQLASRYYPIHRQWLLDNMLYALGERYSEDGSAALIQYSSRSKTPHTVLVAGRLAFTLAKTVDEDGFPRKTVYRQGYQLSQQLVLSQFSEYSPRVPDDTPSLTGVDVYFVITHGPRMKDKTVPAYIKAMVFDATSTLIGSIDLVEYAKRLTDDSSETLMAPTQPMPQVRRKRQESEVGHSS